MLNPAEAHGPAGWGASAYRLLPLWSRARGRLGLRPTVASTATRSWVVSPSVHTVHPAAIYDPEDLRKITGVAPDSFSTLPEQLQRIAAGPREHRATTAYELSDVVLAKAHVFTRRLALPIDIAAMPLLAPVITEEHDAAVLANSHYGIRYFGHWLVDDLALTLAAQDLGRPVSVLLRPSEHQRRYLRALQLDVPVLEAARFKKLVVLDDIGQNAYKSQRYQKLRDRLRGHVTAAGRPVMLLRGASGSRRVLANEDEVARALLDRGFDVIDPMKADVDRVIAACIDTDIVVGVDGSHLAHGSMWMKPGGTLLVIEPPQRFSGYYKGRCDCEGSRFAFIVGDPTPDHGDFRIDVSRLLRLLDRLAVG